MAGLPPLRVHDLRHGFVSLAAQEFPAHRLQALAGHADPRTTARYTHAKARPDDLDRLTRGTTASISAISSRTSSAACSTSSIGKPSSPASFANAAGQLG